MIAAGQQIGGRFRVDDVLGQGGMGVVVSATHLELGHRVAIKLLHESMADRRDVVERFLREARSVVQLRTEHVCRVLDVARLESGAPYIVMELLEGSDLGRVVAKQPLPVTMAVEYVLQACIALAEAHAAGIVHRDVKPANLFVTRRPGGGPLIKVLDFGIAKALTEPGANLTATQGMMGSPGYMSPEQINSPKHVDARTDIWALGATLYQLLTARLPFYRPSATEMAVRIVMEPPDPIDVDPQLRAAVLRCMEKAEAARFATVAELAAALAPFGGPSGRSIAQLVARIAAGASTPLPAAAPVATGAYTAADSQLASVAQSGYRPTPHSGTPSVVGGTGAYVPYGHAQTPQGGTPGLHGPQTPQGGTPGLHGSQTPQGLHGPQTPQGGTPGLHAPGGYGPPAPAGGTAHPPQGGSGVYPPVRAPSTVEARRPRWWLAGVAVLALGGAIAGGVIVARSRATSAPQDTAVAHADAAVDAPIALPIDAGVVLDAPTSDPWAIPDAGVHHADAGVPRGKPRKPPKPAAGSAAPPATPAPTPAPPGAGSSAPVATPVKPPAIPDNVKQQMRAACQQAVQPSHSSWQRRNQTLPPLGVVICWCLLNDTAQAKAAFARLTSDAERTAARQQCAAFGAPL